MGFSYIVLDTEFGFAGLVRSAAGLRRVLIGQPSPQEALRLIDAGFPGAVADPDAFSDLPSRMAGYFRGQQHPFDDRLDLSTYTAFAREVWQAVRAIPYGYTSSYGRVAADIGRPRAARAVGQVLKRNPLPIVVPCHRVLGSDGSLIGFAGGLGMKARLLGLEGVLPPAARG